MMELFKDVNVGVDNPCLTEDALFFFKGMQLDTRSIMPTLDVSRLAEEGGQVSRNISFVGEIVVRMGIWRDFYSYTWIFEKTLKSDTITTESLSIDLHGLTSGSLEIKIYAREDSAVFFAENKAERIDNVQNEHVLYRFIFPSLEYCSEEEIYCKHSGKGIYYSFEDKYVHFDEKGTLDLLTYFNAFSACKWSKYTNIEHLSLFFDFQGKALVSLVQQTEQGQVVLDKFVLSSEERASFLYPLAMLPKEGILGCRIEAEEGSALFGGGYLSEDVPVQEVKLGIGITSFRREQAVTSAVSRLTRAIAAHPVYHDKIAVTVVDNGQTLSAEQLPGATLIPNRNLGGTGGFMRNLLHYKDEGSFTHCLFMDDDASCEAESIFRSMRFMEHAKDASMAISGAMLSENVKFMQWENGAWFDKCCHPLHCNYDLRKPEVLLDNEKEDAPEPTYGAWWFFMFPIRKVSMYSFPFFVRGDDIEFSYTNKFQIARMNGIATWQEDFKIKESPMTLYLDVRSHVLHHLVLEHIDHGPAQILKMVWAFFHRFNWAYQYDTANAIAMSFSDMLEGPKYWLDNMDTGKIRAKIKEKYTMEASRPLRKNYLDVPEAVENVRLPFCTKFIRRVSLNGHLLPGCMVRKGISRLNKYQVPFIDRVFLRDEVLVCNEISKMEIVLKRNPRYFIRNIFWMIKNSIIFLNNYSKLKTEYRKFLISLKEDRFWRNTFSI
ncbi:glycosyltransferase [Mailhella massiliensis]|uniref:glycosyltransferase n=1 Tax=Mailhella massiliensis TaxID=1903261 RepID=UPI0011862B0E|nr:glycosyltransferase [Mailhella massiliensis]